MICDFAFRQTWCLLIACMFAGRAAMFVLATHSSVWSRLARQPASLIAGRDGRKFADSRLKPASAASSGRRFRDSRPGKSRIKSVLEETEQRIIEEARPRDEPSCPTGSSLPERSSCFLFPPSHHVPATLLTYDHNSPADRDIIRTSRPSPVSRSHHGSDAIRTGCAVDLGL